MSSKVEVDLEELSHENCYTLWMQFVGELRAFSPSQFRTPASLEKSTSLERTDA